MHFPGTTGNVDFGVGKVADLRECLSDAGGAAGRNRDFARLLGTFFSVRGTGGSIRDQISPMFAGCSEGCVQGIMSKAYVFTLV